MDALAVSRNTADEQWLQSAREGDAGAFTQIVDRYHEDLIRVAYVVTGDAELARDAAQNAWVKAWRGLKAIRRPEALRPWLVAIAANEARQAARATRRRRLREIPVQEHTAPEDRDDILSLVAVLETLSPEERALLAMRFVAQLSSEEIAMATGLSPSGSRTRLSRIIRRLREEMRDG